MSSPDIPDLKGARVLVVEDDDTTREALTRLLKCFGAEVFTAATLVAGLESLLANDPAVIVLDIMLPDGEGTHILEYVRRKRMPAKVILSSAAYGPLFTSAESLLPDSVLPKPYDAATLAKRIAALV